MIRVFFRFICVLLVGGIVCAALYALVNHMGQNWAPEGRQGGFEPHGDSHLAADLESDEVGFRPERHREPEGASWIGWLGVLQKAVVIAMIVLGVRLVAKALAVLQRRSLSRAG